MKKIFLSLSILLTAATITFAHTNADHKERKEERLARKEIRKEYHKLRRAENRNEVSDVTRNQFAIDFPGAKNARFAKTKEFDEVLFINGKKKLKAYYDYDNELVGTTEKKAFADLPILLRYSRLSAKSAHALIPFLWDGITTSILGNVPSTSLFDAIPPGISTLIVCASIVASR